MQNDTAIVDLETKMSYETTSRMISKGEQNMLAKYIDKKRKTSSSLLPRVGGYRMLTRLKKPMQGRRKLTFEY